MILTTRRHGGGGKTKPKEYSRLWLLFWDDPPVVVDYVQKCDDNVFAIS
jgi:hypothetical protein